MQKKIFYLLAVIAVDFSTATAQTITPQEYIDRYKELAVKEMKRMGIPAAITLAQGLLETESGNSDLVKKSNNHFGIKCKSSWTGEGVTHDDDAVGECFRSYKDAEASYRDHSNYLRGTERYASLFKLDPTDYKGWAKGLRKAGYATNPKYPDILIKNIEQYNLQQYSLEAASEVPKVETDKYEDDKEPPEEKSPDAATKNTDDGGPDITGEGHVNFINGHKYIYAKKGTSLLAIATENDIDLNKLLTFNDLERDGILENDQIIFLQKKSKTGSTDFYIMQQPESLYDVAQKTGIQLSYLLSYNQLTNRTVVSPGSKLYLKPTAETQQAETVKAAAANGTGESMVNPTVKTHSVQPKEGLYGIAKKYRVTVQQLREWNNLTTDNLKIGQQLIVSN
jgi:LysM repeat protein